MDLDACNDKIVAFIAARIASMGRDESGAFNYYQTRAEAGQGLSGYERGLFSVVSGRPGIFHVGIGFGTLTTALAVGGTPCIGFEWDQRRFDGAVDLGTYLEAGDKLELRRVRYPDGLRDDDPTRDATLIFTNLAAALGDEVELAILASFARFARIILDPGIFCGTRLGPGERDEYAARIEGLGYRSETVYKDSTYQFLEFTPG